MSDGQRKVVNGVNTVVMHGKNYVEVTERVRLVHEQKRAFEVIESAPFLLGERVLWRVMIKVDEKVYIGNAEAKLSTARIGSPDATNPFECAETSALGRALAFAGFGSVESIASFDEVYRAQQTDNDDAAPARLTAAPPVPAQSPAVHDLLGKAKNRAKALGLAHDKAEWAAFVTSVLGKPVEDTALSLDMVAKLNGALTKAENATPAQDAA